MNLPPFGNLLSRTQECSECTTTIQRRAAEADGIARAFFAASRDGDVTELSALLARDVEIHSDGGGKVLAF